MNEPFCCRCKEAFPVGNSGVFKMGEMRPLAEIKNPKIRVAYKEWEGHAIGAYLCGNCYFDLTD